MKIVLFSFYFHFLTAGLGDLPIYVWILWAWASRLVVDVIIGLLFGLGLGYLLKLRHEAKNSIFIITIIGAMIGTIASSLLMIILLYTIFLNLPSFESEIRGIIYFITRFYLLEVLAAILGVFLLSKFRKI